MAVATVVEKREKMDLLSCVDVDGSYDVGEGICRFKVRINENGDEEFMNGNGNRR